jgi:hypothetical protein
LSQPESSPTEEGTPFEVHIERGKIREFAAAMQSESPLYQGADAIVPPTFLMTGSQWAPPGARVPHGFERARILHGEQEFIFHGPLPKAGDVLTAKEHISNRYEKEGKRGGTMRFAVIVTEFRNPAGDLVAESHFTIIERAKPPAKEPAASTGAGS